MTGRKSLKEASMPKLRSPVSPLSEPYKATLVVSIVID